MPKNTQSNELLPLHAQMIIDAHEINLDDEEESELLLAQNPELHEAYKRLIALASDIDRG